jgi:hypothetical protein
MMLTLSRSVRLCVFLLDNYCSAEDSEDEYEDDGGGFGWTGDSDDEENPLARAMLLVVSAPNAHVTTQ